ncbi:hypothetical protein HDU91_006780 [Kappamyces sp. JEL0680]|nr:hypothetical protein HDU91_006780 [Kappamyces sp. JEL0680]
MKVSVNAAATTSALATASLSVSGPGNLEQPSTGKKLQRNRATQACDQCSAKRSKCTGTLCCSTCKSLGLSCSYTRKVKKRGPARKGEVKKAVERWSLIPKDVTDILPSTTKKLKTAPSASTRPGSPALSVATTLSSTTLDTTASCAGRSSGLPSPSTTPSMAEGSLVSSQSQSQPTPTTFNPDKPDVLHVHMMPSPMSRSFSPHLAAEFLPTFEYTSDRAADVDLLLSRLASEPPSFEPLGVWNSPKDPFSGAGDLECSHFDQPDDWLSYHL